MSELEAYKLEQLSQKVAELEKMGQLIPFGIIAFVCVGPWLSPNCQFCDMQK